MSPHRGRAFTLIELLVVILIIAVISAIMVPAYAGYYDKSRFDGEVRRIQDYFAQARENAVKGDTTVTLHFERGIHEFSMTVDALPPQDDLPTALLTAAATKSNGGQDIPPYHIGEDYQVKNFNVTSSSANSGPAGVTQTDVHFQGDGTCDRAELVLTSKQGYNAHLSLSPMNGRLALEAAR